MNYDGSWARCHLLLHFILSNKTQLNKFTLFDVFMVDFISWRIAESQTGVALNIKTESMSADKIESVRPCSQITKSILSNWYFLV